MIFLKRLKPGLYCILTILVVLTATSLLDIFLAVFNSRFYSTIAFIVIFGVGGVFASILGYSIGIEQITDKKDKAKWIMITLIIIMGLFFFFFLSKIEGGEYEPAFKSFGITTALTSLIFVKEKIS